MNHQSEMLKSSNPFQSEVRRNKRINCLRYDHRNEYLSYEFWYAVKTMWKLFRSSCHLEHHKGDDVSERHSHTLFGMVHAMMSLIELPLSFMG